MRIAHQLISLLTIISTFLLFCPPAPVYAATVYYDNFVYLNCGSCSSTTITLATGAAGKFGSRVVYAVVYFGSGTDDLRGVAVNGTMMNFNAKNIDLNNFNSVYLYSLITQSTTTVSDIIVASTTASEGSMDIGAVSYLGAQQFNQGRGIASSTSAGSTVRMDCNLDTAIWGDFYIGYIVNTGVLINSTKPHTVGGTNAHKIIDSVGSPASTSNPGAVTISAGTGSNAGWDTVCAVIGQAQDAPYFPF